ncbi:MAG: PEP-CTERM sorting domain-containing protein [Xanthobacteraceae bacterium]
MSAPPVGTFSAGQGVVYPIADTTDFVIASVSATPLPATLPLFAGGLGAIGLLGWRKKRNAQAVAA